MRGKALGAMRGIVGIAGALLIASVFLPWSDGGATAWSAEPGLAALCALAGAAALLGAGTNGQVGVFRPDVSSSGAADLLNVAAMVGLAVFVLFDPSSGELGFGAYLALAAAVVAAFASADWRTVRGAPLFPR